ncbi:hypothetical protein ACFQ0B_14940 [Nonomuraea thailandensis]
MTTPEDPNEPREGQRPREGQPDSTPAQHEPEWWSEGTLPEDERPPRQGAAPDVTPGQGRLRAPRPRRSRGSCRDAGRGGGADLAGSAGGAPPRRAADARAQAGR